MGLWLLVVIYQLAWESHEMCKQGEWQES